MEVLGRELEKEPVPATDCMIRCVCLLVLMRESMQDKPMPHAIRAIQTEEKAMKELGVKYGAGNVRLVKADESSRRS